MMDAFAFLTADGNFVILNLLVQITILATVALLLARRFKHNAATRYGILFPTLLSIAVLVVASVWVQSNNKALFTIPLPSQQASAPLSLDSTAEFIFDAPGLDEISLATLETGNSETGQGAAALPPAVESSSPWELFLSLPLYLIAITVWVGGFLFLTIGLLRSFHNIETLSRRSRRLPAADNDYLQALLVEIHPQQKMIRFRSSDQIKSPMLIGMLNPVILLPQSFVSSLTAQQLKSVLLHELAHYQRKDVLANFLQRIVVTVFWFHPLIHVMDKKISRAREEICDNFVLSREKPFDYGEALLQVSSLDSSNDSTMKNLDFAVGVFGGEWKLEQRIGELLNESRERSVSLGVKTRHALQASIIGLALFLSACQMVSADSQQLDEQQLNDQELSEEAIALEQQARALQQQRQQLDSQTREIAVESRQLNQQRVQLESQARELEQQLVQREQQLTQSRQQLDEQEIQLSLQSNQVEQEVRQQEQEIRQRQQQLQQEVRQQEQQLQQSVQQIREQEERVQDLEQRVRQEAQRAQDQRRAREEEQQQPQQPAGSNQSAPQANDAVYIQTQATTQPPAQSQPQPQAQSQPQREPPPARRSGTLGPQVMQAITEIQELMSPATEDVEADLDAAKEGLDRLYEAIFEEANSFEKQTILNFYTNYYLMLKDYDEAILTFESILQLDQLREDTRLRTLRSLGQLHAAQENWQNSIDYYQLWRAVAEEDDDVVYRGLSYAHYQLENFEESLPYWQSYMELQQENGEELNRDDYAYLNGLYFTLEDFESALGLTKEMILKFNNPTDWRNLRGIYAELDEEISLEEVILELFSAQQEPATSIETIITHTPIAPTDGDYLPLVAVAPQYPTRAAQRGIEGWALVSFTVDRTGDVIADSIGVLDAEPANVFDRTSIRAAAKFKFLPRIVDGVGMEVAGVQYLFRYALEQ